MIPFNDLSRIHAPLLSEFQSKFSEIVMTSSFVLGDEVSKFENELAQIEGATYAIGVNNGTNALELTLRALDIGPGDEVITSALTFVATAHAIEETSAKCVLVDILSNLPLLDPEKIEERITEQTKAIVVVSLHGIVDKIDKYREIANRFGLYLILDGAQSHLGRFNDNPLTNYFDAVTLSFYPGKNLGAFGEAGAVLTNSLKIESKLKISRDWGAKRKYEHEHWGGNFRIEPIQAAMLSIKIKHLNFWTLERKKIAKNYAESLPFEVLTESVSPLGDHVFHMFTIQSKYRSVVQERFNSLEIGWGIHYPRAVHQNAYYERLCSKPGEYRNAELFASNTLSLPVFPGLLESEQIVVIDVLNKVLK
jgi:dTDP-4-amino-4,6-dideoxygalactose transaminase